jgi:hypothetical protein
MSGRDAQMGDTEATQLNSLLEEMVISGILPRVVIFTLDNSGYNDEEDRPDLILCHQLMTEDWCEVVGRRGMDRVGREYLPVDRHLHLLQKHGVDLYLLSFRRIVNWREDDITIRAQMMAAKQEGENFRYRSQDALVRRWLEIGRGWPGVIRYGTVRDTNKNGQFLVPAKDGKQMQIVHYLYERYAAAEGTVSRRQLEREVLQKFKAKLSHPTINRLLRDPIYVTGEWWVSFCGVLYRGKDIEWENPVPLERYQRVQELMALRGGARNPDSEGAFALNGLLRHATCQHMRDKRDKLYRFRGSVSNRGKPTYYHSPGPATDHCRGFSLPAQVIEPAVMRALRQLATDGQLQEAWRRRAQQPERPPQAALNEQQLEDLRQQRQRLIAQRDSIEAREMERCLQTGEDVDLGQLRRVTQLMEDRVAEIEARLTQADQPAPTRTRVEPEQLDNAALVARINEVLTDEAPEDSDARRDRAILVKSLLNAVVVERTDDGLTVELHGWLEGPDQQLAVLEVGRQALAHAGENKRPPTRQGQVTTMRHPEPIGPVTARRERQDRAALAAGAERSSQETTGMVAAGVRESAEGDGEEPDARVLTGLRRRSETASDEGEEEAGDQVPTGLRLRSETASDEGEEEAGDQVLTGLQGAPCNPVRTPWAESPHPVRTPWAESSHPVRTQIERAVRRPTKPAAVLSSRLAAPHQNLDRVVSSDALAPAEKGRAGAVARMSIALGRLSRVEGWEPAFRSPPLEVGWCPPTTQERARENLREAADLMPAEAERLTWSLYRQLRREQAPHLLCDSRVSELARWNGTNFPALATEVVTEVRGEVAADEGPCARVRS